jgi:cell division topological specificity factor
MLDFFKQFFKPTPPSGETAKERLRLVLLSDHLSLAPDVIESLKRDLLEVISRYVDIDPSHADVSFEQRDRELAMLASVPITGIRDRQRPSGDLPFDTTPPPSTPAARTTSSAAFNLPWPEVADVSEPEPETPVTVHEAAPVLDEAPQSQAASEIEAQQTHAEQPEVERAHESTAETVLAESEPGSESEPHAEPAFELAVATPKPKTPRVSANGSRRRRRKKYAAAVAQAKRAQTAPLAGQASAQA